MKKMMKVGDLLRRARQEKCLEYEDIAKETKIHPRFLAALENGDYDLFSSNIHLKGFLKNYAKFLDLNVDEVLAFFRREYDELKNRKEIKNVTKSIDSPRIILTPAFLISIFVSLLVIAFFGYLFYEFRSFAGAPLLVIQQPEADNFIVKSDILNIVGKTDPDATLTINGQRISLGDEGVFSTTITLSEGVNILNFASKNKLGKERRTTKTVVVEKEKNVAETEEEVREEGGGLNLEIRIGPNAAWISAEMDGKDSFDGFLGAGVNKKFQALEGLKIVTGNAGSTQIIFNGEDRGKLGEEGEVKELTFGKDFEKEATPAAEAELP